MYGTPHEVCVKLLLEYPPDKTVALIVWTADDVAGCLADEEVTPTEVAKIVADIPGLDSIHQYGVNEDTLQSMLEGMREEEACQREVVVPANALALVVNLAGDFIRREEAEGGEGSAIRMFPAEMAAFKTLSEMTAM